MSRAQTSQPMGPVQQAVLEVLEDGSELTSRQVGERINRSPQSAAGALHRLWERGVVDRRINPRNPIGYLYRIEGGDP